MRKIPTLFVRNPDNRRYVTPEVTPGCEWVLAGEGTATRKYDGTCVMFDGTDWWARREVRPGKPEPAGWVQVDHDETTGKRTGWEPIEQSAFSRWHAEALAEAASVRRVLEPGTYELCGPKVQGDPERFGMHELVSHDQAERMGWANNPTVGELFKVMPILPWEGIVWHHPDGRMAKLKRRDFPKPALDVTP